MAKVILLSPPYIDLYGKLNKAAGRYFPLGLGYIASYLRKYGAHSVKIYEPEAQSLSYPDLEKIIRENAPDIVGLTCSTPNFSRAIRLARAVKNNSDAKIIIGGVHASAVSEHIVENYPGLIDCVVAGEGEITMLELVKAYENKESLEGIKGIVFRSGNKTIRTETRPFIDDLDSIPFPARDLIPQELFIPNLHNARYRNCSSILTSRGCPFNCSFCASRIVSGKKYRTHSAEYVLEEMQMLKTDFHARQLLITDDTFTIDHERLEKICRGMIEKKLGLEWFCFSQVSTVNKEMLSIMRKAGCYNIGFGIESGNEDILKKMGKPIKPAKALEAVRLAKEAGMKTQAFYIFGTPGETRRQMKETISFAKKVGATLAFFNMLVPYPGTKDFNHFFSEIPLEKINWEKFVAVGEECVLTNAEVTPKEMEELIATANFKYYTNPLRIAGLLFHIRTFYEFSNYVRGGISLSKQIFKWFK
jgi:anaerobic magnesium-protoporphyrin IX monomethyl ester cyclase